MPPHEPLDHQQQNEIYYKNIFKDLSFFFNLRILILFALTLVLVVSLNGLHDISQHQILLNVSNDTVYNINHLFVQAHKQTQVISTIVARIVDKQYTHMQKHNELFYKQRLKLSKVQKMSFSDKYNTTGQHACIDGNCSSIAFYLRNLWSKTLFHKSISSIYLSYYDPLQNLTNIAYTPADSNNLTKSKMKKLFDQATQNMSIHKDNTCLYMSEVYKIALNFNKSFQIRVLLKMNKPEFQAILRREIEFSNSYEYQITDSLGWISLKANSYPPICSYKTGQTFSQIPYIEKDTNQTLINFYFRMPKLRIYFDFLKLMLLLPVFILLTQIFKQKQIYRRALHMFFHNTQRLMSLYEFNIQQIFTGNSPKASIILNSTSTTQFYHELSQIPSPQYEPIKHLERQKVEPKSFQFQDTIKRVTSKYKSYARNIFRQKNKEIINNKFFIHSSVNEISEAQSIKIKETYFRSKQLGLIEQFFKFSYLAILLNPKNFDSTVQQDTSPLPTDCMKVIREVNRTVSGSQVSKAFKLSSNIRKQTQEQLQMRIQINLLQKYIQILKQLDIHSIYAKQLQLEQQLQNINEYIENIKYILNKHNKNIRTLGK